MEQRKKEYKRLLRGLPIDRELFSIVIDNSDILSYKRKFEEHAKKWKYCRQKYAAGKADIEIKGIIPLFAYPFFVAGNIVGYEDVAKQFKIYNPEYKAQKEKECRKYGFSYEEWIDGRLYQFYTGFLRECYFIICVFEIFPNQDLVIEKSFQKDFKENIDLVLNFPQAKIPIGMSNNGKTSDKYNKMRKNEKKKESTVFFTASYACQIGDLNIINSIDIENKIGNMLNAR